MGEVIRLKVATSEEVINLKSASGSLAVEAVSPRVNLEKVDGGTRLDITDVEGTKSTIIPDGEKGDPGESYIFDEHPTDNSPNPVRSRGLKSEFDSVRSDIQYFYDSAVEAVLNSEIRLNMKFGQKQDVLIFDEYPTVNSDNPVKSNGIKILIDAIASTIPRHASDLIDDSGHYTKPPQGIPASDLAYGVIPDISQKQDLLSFDATPTLQSANPVTSNGIKRAIDTVYNQLSGETDLKLFAKADRVNECTEGNFAALDENGNLTDSGSKASDFVTDVQVNGTSVLSNGVANLSSMSDGTTFTPSVSSEGVISWTNDGGKTNPQSVNIKGPQGDPGEDYVLTAQDKADIAAEVNVPVTDVQVNGTSILSNGVAKVKIKSSTPLIYSSTNGLSVETPGNADIKSGSTWTKALTPELQHASAFYGLAKAAGDTTQSSSSNAVGKYTAGAIDKILAMLGVSDLIAPHEPTAISTRAYAIGQAFIHSGKLYKATAAISSGGAIVPGTNCDTTYLVDLI